MIGQDDSPATNPKIEIPKAKNQNDNRSGMAIAKTGHGGSLLESINYNFYEEYAIRGFAPAVRLAYSLAVVTGFALGSLRYA